MWKDFGVSYEKDEKTNLLAQIKAYEALTLSEIIGTIQIEKDQILLIDDVKREYCMKASVTTTDDKGNLQAEDKDKHWVENNIWDGQSLLDESVFQANNVADKGMMLLRNSFFKSCGFHTKIQKWFDNVLPKEQEFILDKFGRKIKRSDVKLITTPSSLKFLKFKDRFGGDEQKCYERWLDNVGSTFGVVKHEEESRFGKYHRLTYQIINSLPLSKADIELLLEYDFNRMSELQRDEGEFIKWIKPKDYDTDQTTYVNPSDKLAIDLLERNPEMWRTQLIIDIVNDKIDSYKEYLQKGRISVKDSDYAVLFGNPLEMLQYAVLKTMKSKGKFGIQLPLDGDRVYCERYEDGRTLAGFRNPHITMGNVLVTTNTFRNEFKRYFKLTKNIVISNAYNTDIMHRLQGQDYDSDTLFLCPNEIIVEAARKVQHLRVPINGIAPISRETEIDISGESAIDHVISRNYIGVIVNNSQVLNSYYWDYYNKNYDNKYDGYLEEYYRNTSILSSLSQIEIDKAKNGDIDETESDDKGKKTYTHIISIRKSILEDGKRLLRTKSVEFPPNTLNDTNAESVFSLKERLRELTPVEKHKEERASINAEIKEIVDSSKDEKKVLVRPNFMKICAVGKRYAFEHFDTAMDYLFVLTDKYKFPRKLPKDKIQLTSLFNKELYYDRNEANRRQLDDKIEVICNNVDNSIRRMNFYEKHPAYSRNYIESRRREIYTSAIRDLRKTAINSITIMRAIELAYAQDKGKRNKRNYSKIGRVMMSLLYQAHPDNFLQCFKEMSNERS